MDTEARLAIFAIMKKKPWGKSKWRPGGVYGRLTHVIPSMPIKDRTVAGPFDKIERMHIT